MFCRNCGKEISDTAFCPHCGTKVQQRPQNTPGMHCPNCGSSNIDMQVYQENTGSSTVSKTTSMYRQKGHGCLWWLLIGWWWWVIDLLLWLLIFPVRLIAQLTKKKKYVGDSTSVSSTTNTVQYRTVCLCKNCAHRWYR